MPLHMSMFSGARRCAARLLLDKGAEVDRANGNMRRCISPARTDTPTQPLLLLDKGADVDQSRNGVTLLFLACQNGHVDVVRNCCWKEARRSTGRRRMVRRRCSSPAS